MNNPFVSFIVPTIARTSLSQTVISLIRQTDPDWEAWIIGDALDEQGEAFLKENCTDNRVRGINLLCKAGQHTRYGGQGGLVRNQILDVPKGEWLGFVDDDDTLNAEYVASLREESKDADLVVFRMMRENGEILPPPGDNRLISCRVGISFAVRTEFAREHKLEFINNDQEDFVFLSACLNAGARCKVSDDVMYYVRWGGPQ